MQKLRNTPWRNPNASYATCFSKEMPPQQIAEVQRMAREWLEKRKGK